MIGLTERDFQALCADERVRRIIDAADRSGRSAAFGFWGILLAGLLMISGATWYLIAIGHDVLGVMVGSVGVLLVYILAAIPLAMAGRAIKLPVYEIIAERHGLAYAPLAEGLPVYAESRPALFGAEPVAESFTDCFQGELPDATGFATCQAYILGETGRRFNGRLFIFFQGDGLRLGSHAPDLFRELGRYGKVRHYEGPDGVLVALQGRKGFTPGLGFRFRRGEARVRAMFDDLADSLALLSRLQGVLDRVP